MSLIIEYFGEEIFDYSFEDVKKSIREVEHGLRERKGYMLKEYAKIKGIALTAQDYNDIDA